MKDEITLEQAFKLLGLKEVRYDPWGNGLAYLWWLYHLKLDDISHDRLGFWTHIRTCGTLYLAWTYFVTAQHTIDFHSMRANLLLFIKEHGMLIEELVQKLMPKEERWRKLLDYTKPLPPAYIGHLWMDTEYPLRQFISDTKYNIVGRLAGEEFHRRTETYPELGSLVRCITGHSPYYRQEAIDRGLAIPDGDKEFQKLWDYAKRAMKGKISIQSIKSLYSEEDEEQDKIISIFQEIQKTGGENYGAVLERDKMLASALDGKLGGYLNRVTIHDIQDITGRIRRGKEKESLETEIDAGPEAEGIEVEAPFLDTMLFGNNVTLNQDLGRYEYKLAEEEEKRELIEQIFRGAKLTARQRQVYEMRGKGDLPYKEIAYRLCITSDNARRIYHEADKKVKEFVTKSR